MGGVSEARASSTLTTCDVEDGGKYGASMPCGLSVSLTGFVPKFYPYPPACMSHDGSVLRDRALQTS